MGTVSTAQINVRIDRTTKDAGDRELARRNISPSRIVRGVWEKLAQGGEEALRVVDATLRDERPSERQVEIERKLEAMRRVDASWERFVETVGIDPDTYVPLTDEELEEARYQHLMERCGA